MAQRYWNGHSWRRVSDVEARFRRARGEQVVDGEAKLVAFVKAPGERVEVALPEPPPLAGVESFTAVAEKVGDELAKLPADLTDDELEALTKPGS